jgi:hypothetical protein
MKHHLTLALALGLLLAGLSTEAGTYRLQFTAGGFPASGGIGAPTDPVGGTFVFAAADAHADIQSFLSVNLTLAGHAYSVGQIGYWNPAPDHIIGGLLDGMNMGSNTDDFGIIWNADTLAPINFAYTSSHYNKMWAVSQSGFSAFAITEVPEPGSAALLLLGGLGAAAFRRPPPLPRSARLDPN